MEPDRLGLINTESGASPPLEGGRGEVSTPPYQKEKPLSFKQHLLCILLACFSVGLFTACKQDSAAKTNTASAPETAQTTDPAQAATTQMRTMLQGKWKPVFEPGVVYEIRGEKLQRFLNNKLEYTSNMTYSTSCAASCGAIGKQYAGSGVVGCITLSAPDEVCFWVISYAHDQFDFVRMGSPDAKPESWIKM